ncbi:hypothetical protein PMAYCL1PPCAC_09416 [Pristionchus mayeri]|uniref:Uncharacterized protein n=1 Tax=Pristionchus mayeri TaxID=1317129 RepID=A0AAN4ZHL3_9BILA|nr:hypothetical protein PMAYCL1PPCAC_09416 [Pristionchus mayeri]
MHLLSQIIVVLLSKLDNLSEHDPTYKDHLDVLHDTMRCVRALSNTFPGLAMFQRKENKFHYHIIEMLAVLTTKAFTIPESYASDGTPAGGPLETRIENWKGTLPTNHGGIRS